MYPAFLVIVAIGLIAVQGFTSVAAQTIAVSDNSSVTSTTTASTSSTSSKVASVDQHHADNTLPTDGQSINKTPTPMFKWSHSASMWTKKCDDEKAKELLSPLFQKGVMPLQIAFDLIYDCSPTQEENDELFSHPLADFGIPSDVAEEKFSKLKALLSGSVNEFYTVQGPVKTTPTPTTPTPMTFPAATPVGMVNSTSPPPKKCKLENGKEEEVIILLGIWLKDPTKDGYGIAVDYLEKCKPSKEDAIKVVNQHIQEFVLIPSLEVENKFHIFISEVEKHHSNVRRRLKAVY